MTESLLVLNAGSSSIKFAVYPLAGDGLGERSMRGQVAGIGQSPRLEASDTHGRSIAAEAASAVNTHGDALERLLAWLDTRGDVGRVIAAGHRVVHGGEKYAAPVRIDDGVIADLQALVPMARLHQPYEIDAILALRRRHAALCQVACFDTAFHRTLPQVAQQFPLPRAVIDSGVRRYGFHGLSYAYVAGKLEQVLVNPGEARAVVAHLGSGSSMCAMRGGVSQATTMGFTVLDGLMMGTRSGSIDPGIVFYLIQERGMDVQRVSDLLYRHSGLLGVSGVTSDMRELLASAHPHAREAVDLYVYSVVREAGALIACLGGIDALVFTAGIGEHAAPVRQRVCEALAWLGIEVDTRANAQHALCISTGRSRVSVWVIPTDEELVIARATRSLASC
ncbi:MAG: acetate/propionate family kinase [Burkholderiales bacterium]|nr:acetate/propionate family kinase [Burkholderiales bacterium]